MIFYKLWLKRSSFRLKFTIILFFLSHEYISKLLFNIFTEKHTLSVSQEGRFCPVIEFVLHHDFLVVRDSCFTGR